LANHERVTVEVEGLGEEGKGQRLRVWYRRIEGGLVGNAWDTAAAVKEGSDAARYARGLLDVPVEVVVGAEGMVVRVDGMERVWAHYLAALKGDAGGRFLLKDYREQYGEKRIAELVGALEEVRAGSRRDAVRVGERWERRVEAEVKPGVWAEMVRRYEVIGVSGGLVEVSVRGEVERPVTAGELEQMGVADLVAEMEVTMVVEGKERWEVGTGMPRSSVMEIGVRTVKRLKGEQGRTTTEGRVRREVRFDEETGGEKRGGA
jgi:hypothetical protein